MSGRPDDSMMLDDSRVREWLITLFRLSEGDTSRVEEMMAVRNLPFGMAAIACEVVTPHELKQAMEMARQSSSDSFPNIVETAIRQRKAINVVALRRDAQVKPGPKLFLAHDPSHPRSERVRALRTELLLLQKRRRGATAIALLSPGTGEGRSLLAAELAISLAQIGRRTLLVDADLRRPSQHILFGAENNWGLAQSLAFTEAAPLLGVESVPQMSLITAGPPVPNRMELLSDGGFERSMSGWRQTFDYIVLDTPPIAEFSDALTVATMAGSALILMRASSTTHNHMREMMRRLGATQAHILGAVMNHF